MTPEQAGRMHTYLEQAVRLLKGLLRYLESAAEEFRLESVKK